MQWKYRPSLKREDVVRFAMCRFDQPRDVARQGVRRTSWGYRVLDPLSVTLGITVLGDGPIVVHGESGVYVPLSSNPHDMFGPRGYNSLRSVEDVNNMINDWHRHNTDTIYNVIRECELFYTEQGKPHVHN